MRWFTHPAPHRTAHVRTARRHTPLLERLEDRTLLDAGFLDPTFGSSGRAFADFLGPLDNPAQTVVRQADGKLLVLGYAANGVSATSTADLVLARYSTDGSLDTTFGNGGRARANLGLPFQGEVTSGLQLLPDGKVKVAAALRTPSAGIQLVVAQFTPTGSADTTFNVGGVVLRDTGLQLASPTVAFQPDGKILLAGQAATNATGPTLARFTPRAGPDETFGVGGTVTTALQPGFFMGGATLLVQPDAKIVLVGTGGVTTPLGHFLIRYTAGGGLDTDFGNGGTVFRVPLLDQDSTLIRAAVQPDGKIVVANTSNVRGPRPTDPIFRDFEVLRYTASGARDLSFGDSGVVTIDFNGGRDQARGVTLQTDGKILVAGTTAVETANAPSDFALTRLNPNGSLDDSFGTGGKLTTDFGSSKDEVNSVQVDPDGKIVVAGSTLGTASDFALARYTATGTLDAGFGTSGKVSTDFTGPLDNSARGVAVQPDGKIVVAGSASNGATSDFVLVRFLPSGAPDLTFNGKGSVTTTFDAQGSANAVALQADGKIVAAGSSGGGMAVGRYLATGALDSSFGSGGKVTIAFDTERGGTAHGLAIQPDGKLVLAGSCGAEAVLARLNPVGSLDSSFGSGGRVGSCDFLSRGGVEGARVVLSVEGKIVTAVALGGLGSGVLLNRYNSNGSRDTTFGLGGSVRTGLGIDPGPKGPALRLQPDGKIVVGGTVSIANVTPIVAGVGFGVLRYNADGTPDTSFGLNSQVNVDFAGRDSVADLLILPDGKIVVVGPSAEVPRNAFMGLSVTQLLPNGKLNTSFGTAGKVGVAARTTASPAAHAALTPDGMLVVVGAVTGEGSGTDFLVTRFTLADTFVTANQRYVGQLYLNLLGRSADMGGLGVFTGLLDRGAATRAQVAQAITVSEEYRTVVVQNLYRTLLGREADPGGLGVFVAALRAGTSIAQLKAVLIGSAEYFQKNGGTNESFVMAVFRDVLGRDVDATGQQIFSRALTVGVPRTAVAGQIVASIENVRRIIQGWYRQYLRRSADTGGLIGFQGFLAAGGREETAVTLFLSSGEFMAGL